MKGEDKVLGLACLLTLLHYTGAYMRVRVLPLYASAQGATVTQVGLIVGAHTTVAALSAIPFGLASDRWGRRVFLRGGMALSALTSFLLPLAEQPTALIALYGAAGLGVSAFTSSVMSLVGDVTAPGAAGRAYAWYATAPYAGFGLGPIVGGFVAQHWGHRAAFVGAGVLILAAVMAGTLLPRGEGARRGAVAQATAREVGLNPRIWSGWIATVSGLVLWGAMLAFFPLFGRERGLSPLDIGLVLSVQSLVNTVARVPLGWLIDRTRARRPWIAGGLLVAALGTLVIPHLGRTGEFVLLGVCFAASFVAVGAALTEATTPATRGLAMGGYSTAIYVRLGLASIGLAPVMATWGYAAGSRWPA